MDTIFMVTYRDDDRNKHIAFLKEESEIKFIEDRFDSITIEKVDKEFVAAMVCDNLYSD